jgi:hypothetical protein
METRELETKVIDQTAKGRASATKSKHLKV